MKIHQIAVLLFLPLIFSCTEKESAKKNENQEVQEVEKESAQETEKQVIQEVEEESTQETEKKTDQEIEFVKLEKQVKSALTQNTKGIRKSTPKIISLNADQMEYLDFNENRIYKVDLKTLQKSLSYTLEGGDYFWFFKQTEKYRAVSNGGEFEITSRIKVGNEEEVVFESNMILDCLNEKILINGVLEGIEVDNHTQVYNVETKKLKKLKIDAWQGVFMDENKLLLLKTDKVQKERVNNNNKVVSYLEIQKELVIYNLLDDSYEVVVTPFDVYHFIQYFEKEKILYFVDDSLVKRIFLENEKSETVYNEVVTSPYIVNNEILVANGGSLFIPLN